MVHIAAWQQIYYNGLPPACQAFYHYTFHLFPIFSRVASKRGDEGEALKKVGIALIFIGTAILLFVLTINILVWTGRFGVAS